jgi:hypothetical protein
MYARANVCALQDSLRQLAFLAHILYDIHHYDTSSY